MRRATSEAEAWEVRLSALAMLGEYDALTFVTGGAESAPGYNLRDDPGSEPAIRDAIDEALRSGTSVQVRVAVPLADGRVATSVLVTPLAVSGSSDGAVLALRVGRPFAGIEAQSAVGVAELLSLEVARVAGERREDAERRHALALYELARHALFTDDLDDALQSIAMVLASALDHAAAHIWLRSPDGTLRRHAAYPPDDSAPEIAWETDHNALIGALHERRLVRVADADAAWTPSNTGHLLVVPLRGDPRPVGVLVLARADTPYGLDDIETADVFGTFIGRVVTSARRGAASTRGERFDRPRSEAETEEEFAES